jgi:hypothetical protein
VPQKDRNPDLPVGPLFKLSAAWCQSAAEIFTSRDIY